jgi:hypothetical protein
MQILGCYATAPTNRLAQSRKALRQLLGRLRDSLPALHVRTRRPTEPSQIHPIQTQLTNVFMDGSKNPSKPTHGRHKITSRFWQRRSGSCTSSAFWHNSQQLHELCCELFFFFCQTPFFKAASCILVIFLLLSQRDELR